MHNNGHFISPTYGKISIIGMTGKIASFVKEDPNAFYKLIIGTDSQVKRLNGVAECDYVTAIVIHKAGLGGKYFWHKERVKVPVVLRDRIYKETMMSLETAELLIPEIRKSINGGGKYELEIHIDVGNAGKTREMIKEVVGMVTGNGYTARTKPDSFGASWVADRHT